jgi:ligand-binding sensor domain-containing protein
MAKLLKYGPTLILLTINFWLRGQDHMYFNHYSLNEGLSQNTITAIVQDGDGFMWLGTNDGLNKYDGYEFTIYRSNPSDPDALRNDAIFCLLVDSRENLWIGTRGGGLHRYDNKMDRFVYYDLNLTFNVIRCIMEDSMDNLWIGTNSGLFLLNRETGTYIKFDHNSLDPFSLAQNMVNTMAEDIYGNMWIGTPEYGLEQFDRQSGTFTHFGPQSDKMDKIPLDYINVLYADNQGYLWIGSDRHGLAVYNISDKSLEKYPVLLDQVDPGGLNHYHIEAILPENENKMWIATFGGGLSLLDRSNSTFQHFYYFEDVDGSLSKNSLYSVFKDRWGNLWVGTEGGGLNFSDAYKKQFAHFRTHTGDASSLSANSILTVLGDKPGRFWLGSDDGGLNYFDSRTGKFQRFYHDPDNPGSISQDVITSLCKDQNGGIWVGSASRGLNLLDQSNFSFTSFEHDPGDDNSLSNNNIYSIFEDSRSRFWVGTNGGGLNLFEKASGRSQRFMHNEYDHRSLSNNYITDIFEDSGGNVWIGTWEGLNRLEEHGTTFNRYFYSYQDSTSISNNEITFLFEDSKDRLWVGTYGGLNLYDRSSNSFIHYSEREGLPNNVICSIQEDSHGYLWISTFEGISRFHPDNMTVRNYDINDGLQGNQFNIRASAISPSGEMLFGGINGFNYFHPDSIHDNPNKPMVHLTGFRLYNRKVKIGGDDTPLETSIWETELLSLKHYQSTFTFEFTALNYSSSENCRYKYKLEDFDENWVDNETGRAANYTNVPPGKYTFRVIASNNDGIWEEEGIALNIIIHPPYWATWWFRILVTILAVSIALLIHQLRVYNIKRQKKNLEKEVSIRTKEVVQQKSEIETQADSLRKANKEIINKNITLEFQKEEIETQAEEIRRMNVLLRSRNINLTRDVKEKSKALVMQKRVTFEEFREIYPDDEACLSLIWELKSTYGFECPNCHHDEFYELSGHNFRRCKKCGYRESITVNTIFYRLKFPIVKAFYILYLVSTGRELTVDELSELISLRRETCWAFRNKVMDIMRTRKRFKNPREGWKELILLPEKSKKTHSDQ